MPIIVALFALIALVYGAVRAFYALQAAFGLGVAIGVAVVAGLLVVAAIAYWLRRRKEVAPNIRDGDWTHELKGSWGSVRLAAGKRLCEIRLDGERGDYIFADLVGAEVEEVPGDGDGRRKWRVALKVKDSRHGVWLLPMRGAAEARQWRRVFLLAISQKL